MPKADLWESITECMLSSLYAFQSKLLHREFYTTRMNANQANTQPEQAGRTEMCSVSEKGDMFSHGYNKVVPDSDIMTMQLHAKVILFLHL